MSSAAGESSAHLSLPPRSPHAAKLHSLQIDTHSLDGDHASEDPLRSGGSSPSGVGLGLLSGFQSASMPSSSRLEPPPIITSKVSAPKSALSSSSRPNGRPSRPLSSYSAMTAPRPQDLDLFARQCRSMFEGDQQAARAVEQTMRTLPAGAKASYTKTMATVRSVWHRDAAASRRATVDRLLTETQPGSSVLSCIGHDSSLGALRSPRARQERHDRLARFLASHCVRDMVGVHPYFTSLYVALHLMGRPAKDGGTGKRRLDWDVDTMVFSEAGAGSFLSDSIELIKGILGFEDHLKPLTAPSFTASRGSSFEDEAEDRDEDPTIVYGHPDGDDGLTLEERQEVEMDELVDGLHPTSHPGLRTSDAEGPFADSSASSSEEEVNTAVDKGKRPAHNRVRALSDPFGDPEPPADPASPKPAGFTAPGSPSIMISPAEDIALETLGGYGQGPAPLDGDQAPSPVHKRSPTLNSLDAPPPSEIRTFRSPSYLTDPELRELAQLFPPFITTKAKLVRFGRADDALQPGHGALRLSVFERDEGWKGGILERFRLFLFRLFRR